MAAVSDATRVDDVSLLLRYGGPAVDSGTMDVYDVAANMMAFSDYVVIAGHELFGDSSTVKADVQAFRSGSFVTDFLFHFVGISTSIFAASGGDLDSLTKVVKESIAMFKFLGGKPPQKVEHQTNNTVKVTNNNGELYIFQTESLNITLNPKAGAAVERFVQKALSKPGVKSLNIASDQQPIAQISFEEADSFRPIDTTESVIVNEIDAALTIETPSFKDGNKWRLWDGENTLAVAIEDVDFIAAVDRGEPFRKGDVLLCKLRITQYHSGANVRTERAIVSVQKHIQRMGDQADMFEAGSADDAPGD